MRTLKQRKAQVGVGLVELMVSVAIGLFILAGVIQLYLTSAQNVSSFEGSSRIQENARYVFARLEKDIGQTGNMGCFSASFVSDPDTRVHSLLGASTQTLFDYSSFVSGNDDTGPGKYGAGSTDQFVVRYAQVSNRFPVLALNEASQEITLPPNVVNTLNVGQVLILADCSKATIFAVSGVNAGSNTVAYKQGASNGHTPFNATTDLQTTYTPANANSAVEGSSLAYVYVNKGSGVIPYQIGDSAAGVCSAATPQFCALLRDGVEIVEGVADLQIVYGWITGAGNLMYADATTIEADTNKAAIWRLIDRIRVTATFNSIDTATTNEGVGLLYRTYSQVFVLHNQLPSSI